MGIQIYDQISVLRNYSKVNLRCAVSLGLGLKGVKIAWNVAEVGVHACLSNGHQNLWSSLNSEKLVKSETPSCGFVRVWLKGAESSSKYNESWCALLYSKYTSKSMIKF